MSDTGGELVAVTAAGSVDDICAAVRSWLDDFLAPAQAFVTHR